MMIQVMLRKWHCIFSMFVYFMVMAIYNQTLDINEYSKTFYSINNFINKYISTYIYQLHLERSYIASSHQLFPQYICYENIVHKDDINRFMANLFLYIYL